MEIKIKNSSKSKTIDVDNTIISIQTMDQNLISNLISDYDVMQIDYLDNYFIGETVINEITAFNEYPELSFVACVMKVLDLEKKFLNSDIKTLSTTEKIYLNILRNISKNKKIILFKNIFSGLDLKNRKKIIKLINFLKENSYVVFICSDDVDVLYKYSDYSLLANKDIIKFDNTDEIYTDVQFLIKNKFEIPTLSYITYKAKEEKNIKLFYSKDVRDIIKDVYKHV